MEMEISHLMEMEMDLPLGALERLDAHAHHVRQDDRRYQRVEPDAFSI